MIRINESNGKQPGVVTRGTMISAANAIVKASEALTRVRTMDLARVRTQMRTVMETQENKEVKDHSIQTVKVRTTLTTVQMISSRRLKNTKRRLKIFTMSNGRKLSKNSKKTGVMMVDGVAIRLDNKLTNRVESENNKEG